MLVVDNVIHDTTGAGLGVNGGYNVTMANNTLYRVGERSHAVEFVMGARSCDDDSAACLANHEAGGWGAPGISGQFIPNRHVGFYNNVVYNPPGYSSAWAHFTVADPTAPPPGCGVPDPARADDDLRIVNNLVWNGPPNLDTGVPSWIDLAGNRINDLQPAMVDPAAADYRLIPGTPAAALHAVGVPGWNWDDSGVPGGSTDGQQGGGVIGARR